MSKWIAASVGVLVAAIVPHAAPAQDDAPLEAVVTLHPGPPLGTLPLGVPPRMDRPWVFKQGRPILVSFTITNVSAAECRFLDAMSFTGRSGDCSVEVYHQGGGRVEDPIGDVTLGGAITGETHELKPGECITHNVYLNDWAPALSPGRYWAVGAYALDGNDGVIHSQPVEFSIVDATANEMGVYIDTLAGELGAESAIHSEQAATYLGFTDDRRAVRPLVRRLYGPRPWSAAAFQALWRLGRLESCEAELLTALAVRGPTPVVVSLLTSQYRVPDSELLEPLLDGLERHNADRRAAAAQALGTYAKEGDRVLRSLVAAATDPEPEVRRYAVNSITRFSGPVAEEALLRATEDPDWLVRWHAVPGLAKHPTEASIGRLQELLDADPRLAQAAVSALRDIGADAALNALRMGLHVRNREIRWRAAAALLRHGDDSVRPLLAEALVSAPPYAKTPIMTAMRHAVWDRGIWGPGDGGPAATWDYREWLTWLQAAPDEGTTQG